MPPHAPIPPAAPAAPPVRDAPAFDFYPERWLVGVAGMSDPEQLAYLRLLCHQWLLGDTGLPPDLPALRRLGGSKGITPAVLAKLPLGADGKRRNTRLEIIRTEQRERIAKKSEQRRVAARKRWHQPGEAPPEDDAPPPSSAPPKTHAPGMRSHCGSTCEGDADSMRSQCGGTCEGDAAGMPTTHHPPPTSAVPEDANNAGASKADSGKAPAAPDAAPRAKDTTTPRPTTGAAEAPAPDEADRSTPSLPTVHAWAVAMGCPADKAEIWWHEHEARPLSVHGRWTDRDGNAVQRPQHALAAWWQKWRANDHQRSTRNHLACPPHRATPARSDTANAPGRYG